MVLLNAIILLLLIAGHTEVLVTLVNRTHGLRIPGSILRHIRHLHDVLLPTFAVLLIWQVGFNAPGVLKGGSWAELSIAWKAWLGICAVGLGGLLCSSARWLAARLPKALLSNHSTIVNIETELGRRPITKGKFEFLTHVPGNQLLEVEVNEKTVRFDRRTLTPCKTGNATDSVENAVVTRLSILHISDLHFIGTLEREFFEAVIQHAIGLNADIAVFTGDLLDEQSLASWIPSTLGRISAPLGNFYILGNHDWYLDPGPIRSEFEACGWTAVAGEVGRARSADLNIEIGGTELPWMGQHPTFSPTDPDTLRILLSHTPDNLAWAKQQSVPLMLSGHNHGGQVVLPLIGPVYAPSVHGVRYASGTFHEDGTLLHVSRGVSGRHPLRWNCRPEITKLVLEFVGPSKGFSEPTTT